MSPVIQSDDEPNDRHSISMQEYVDTMRKLISKFDEPEKKLCTSERIEITTQTTPAAEIARAVERELTEKRTLHAARARTDAEKQAEELRERISRIASRSSRRSRLPESDQSRVDLDQGKGDSLEEGAVSLRDSLKLVIDRLGAVETVLEKLELLFHRLSELERNVHGFHDSSLTGYGADRLSAPIAPGEAATSAGGDIVGDGTDTTPGDHAPVEKSDATGAAQPNPGPHHNPSSDAGRAH